MTPQSARASYRRDLALDGEPMTLRRVQKRPAADIEVSVLGRVLRQGDPQTLANGTTVVDRVVLVLAEDLETAGFPLPLVKTDKIVLRGRQLTIEKVDDDVRRIGGVLIAYELTARG